MNEQTNVQTQDVTVTPEQAAKLQALAEQLRQNGKVALQTQADIGDEQLSKPTVH